MKILITLLFFAAGAMAQIPNRVRFVTSNPSGTCSASYITQNTSTGALYGCVGGTWASIGGGGTATATFLLCAGPCVALETSNWKWTAPAAATVTGCIVDAVTYPTGAAITVDVLKTGVTTIFTSTVPTLAAGSSSYNEQTGMAAAATLAKGDYLMAKVLTIGSTIAGQNVNVVCSIRY